MGKYNPLSRSRLGREKAAHRQEYPDYKSRVEVANAAALQWTVLQGMAGGLLDAGEMVGSRE